MDTRQYCICLNEGVYASWHAIGALENLTVDADIAQFLVTLYSSQKQKVGEETSLRCVHCHCSLTLYCGTCQCPSHLALPSLPPPPSLSSPPPTTSLLPQVLDTSASLSVTSDPVHTTTPVLGPETFDGGVKHESSAGLLEDEEVEFDDDCAYQLDFVKAEMAGSGCDLEPGFTAPVINFRLTPSSREGSRRPQRRRGGRKAESSASVQSTRKRNTASAASQSKAGKSKLTGKNKRCAKNEVKHLPVEDVESTTTSISEGTAVDFEEKTSTKDGDGLGTKGGKSCGGGTPEKANKERRKRKPCALQDLEEGHILSEEERRSAQIHMYDDSYFQRHSMEDSALRHPGRRKRKKASPASAKRAPKEHRRKGLKRKCVTLSPANYDSSSTEEEETTDCRRSGARVNHPSLSSHRQNGRENITSQSNGTDVAGEDLKHEVLAAGTESSQGDMDQDDSDKQPLRILVSAQKILPLRTKDGNYARLLYSYFECAHCKKAFTHKRAFNGHVQTHVEQKFNNCTMCENGSECSCDYVKHESRPTLQCEMCGVHLKSLYALRFHIAAIHKNDRPFKCSLCEKSFVLKTKLRSHLKYKHAEGGRLFHCDQCSYRAFDARGLKVHQMCVHSKERPFKCTYCPSAFAIKFYLDVHLRKHTGEKPFRCSECSQTFAQRPSLTRHRRNYHGLEPASNRQKTDLSGASSMHTSLEIS
ncbi:uncharacterized protein LOC143274751 [Babylonia areolata]|uniref:uncharacterized protein LOC143274751 n=1 Tax=Babylonia areolata TaxID=304850 RepID=UPI003FD384C8